MKITASGLIVFLLMLLSACGAGTVTNNPPPPPPPPPTVNANVAVQNTPNGSFNLAMSTSFQPAEWDYQFFQNVPSATGPLNNLGSHHIRLQGLSRGIPQVSSTSWDFTVIDAITQPVLGVADHSPEFQIAKAPAFMYDSQGNLDVPSFTGYAQNLVLYYNKGGFTDSGGTFHASPSSNPITWWGIYNEPNINNMSDPAVYTSMYNAIVPAMQQVDPTLKFVAVELSGGYNNWEQVYYSYFVQNVSAHVDVAADHLYSSCNQTDTDEKVFGTVPGFAGDVQTIYGYLSTNPALANVPVWILENNVNADFSDSTGHSVCNPNQVFVTDQRGTSAFFAAWRPYVFSQVGKAGAQALYHWDFDADAQYGEVDFNTGNIQLSYWIDYWLARYFPGGSGQQLLNFTNSNNAQVEVLPVVNADHSVVIMVSNHAVASATDNNGKGLTGNISIDISALGPFTSATELLMDSTTNVANGPISGVISPASPINLTMNGYSVAFVKLVP